MRQAQAWVQDPILLFQVREACSLYCSSILPLSISLPFWEFISSIKIRMKKNKFLELDMQQKYLCSRVAGMTLDLNLGLIYNICL